jgi:hypothetical protein
MTGAVIRFTAARTARTLRQNAPPDWIDGFVARMTRVAREQSDSNREDFWREVARLAGRAEPAPEAALAAAGAKD